ncbi:MAG: bifunctional oligoribonuclease/PAP phosphatase NrnA [Candidatus Omnitrophica bacterium]|nr:bifunctional oligoribonuclease/PAP phosphatase NrnA [Candidatus Omnitrophota bacterium]
MGKQKILKILQEKKSFLVTAHVNPDPDALCSQLAIALYLKSLGKKVFAICDEAVPQRFNFIPAIKEIQSLEQCPDPDFEVAVILDCGDLERIGAVSKLIKAETLVVNIDHHITNTAFADVNWNIPGASSTAEVIYDLLCSAKFSFTKEMAILLYLGIMTDTGSFRYDNASARTHRIVSDLMEFDFSVSELYRKLYEAVPLNDLKYFTQVVSKFEALYNGRVVCLELSKSVVKKFSEEFDLRDKIFQYLRTIKSVEVLVILTEQDKKRTRINLRSQGSVDVARIAAEFDGGGHYKASGCIIDEGMKVAKRKILAQIRKAL